MTRRRLLAGIGLVLAAFGVVLAIAPALSAAISAHVIVMLLVGALMAILGYMRYRRASQRDRPDFDMDDPEERPPVLTPGANLDAHWDRYRTLTLAVTVLQAAHGCSAVRARELLATGEWTENPIAAEYFQEMDTDPPARTYGVMDEFFQQSSQSGRQREAALLELYRMTDRGEVS